MKDTVWLKCNARGVVGMTKKMPNMKAGEIVVKLGVHVNQGHFRLPTATAEIVLDEQHIIHPTAEVMVEDAPVLDLGGDDDTGSSG